MTRVVFMFLLQCLQSHSKQAWRLKRAVRLFMIRAFTQNTRLSRYISRRPILPRYIPWNVYV